MKGKNKYGGLIFWGLFLNWHLSLAQNEIPVGSWRYHSSHSEKNLLTGGQNALFAMGKNDLLFFSKEEQKAESLDRSNGLYSQDFMTMVFAETHKTLVIAYQDGTLDLVKENKIQRIPEIRSNALIREKKINRIRIYGNFAWIAGDFGLAVLDLTSGQFLDSYLNLGISGDPLGINDVMVHTDSIYLAFDQGILLGQKSKNLKDFRNWERMQEDGSPGYQILEETDNRFFLLGKDNKIYQLENGSAEWLIGTENVSQLKKINDVLYFATKESIQQLLNNGSFISIAPIRDLDFSDFFLLEKEWYLATSESGILRWPELDPITINGPISATQKFLYLNQSIYSIPNRITAEGSIIRSEGQSVSMLSNGVWSAFTSPKGTVSMVKWRESLLFGTVSEGIFQYNEGGLSRFLPEQIPGNVPVSGLTVNREGNLVITFLDHLDRAFLVTPNEEITVLSIPDLEFPLKSLVDWLGNSWILERRHAGNNLRVFNAATGLNRTLGTAINFGGLPSNQVLDIHLDHVGNIWVGTLRGPAYLPMAAGISASSPINAVIPIFENRSLLANQEINGILVAPDNTKWFAANGTGLWHFSENFEKLLQNYNFNNSPIPSNSIQDLTLDDKSGEIFFVSDQVAFSHRAGSIRPAENLSGLKIFPNPVRPDFIGVLSVEGLTDFSELKITNAAGRTVVSMVVQGGKITWNLRYPNGNKVAPGIYLVFAIDQNGKEKAVGKFLIMG